MPQVVSFVKGHPRSSAFVFGIIAAGVLLSCVELISFILLKTTIPASSSCVTIAGTGVLCENDDLLGYKLVKNLHTILKFCAPDGREVCRVSYDTDEYGRRITPVDHAEQRTNYILFFGCSFVFGMNAQADETIPYYVGTLAPRYRPYNYGVHGYGPNQLLARLQDRGIRKEIPEAQGVAVYVFLGDEHVRRAMGGMEVYDGITYNAPYYIIDHRGRLVRKGGFTSGRPILSLFYGLLRHSQTIKYWRESRPYYPHVPDWDVQLTGRMIEEAYKCYREIFGNSNFCVVLYPHSNPQRVIPYLERAGIRYFDYTGLLDLNKEENHMESDGHPSAKANLIVARQLTKDLGILQDLRSK